MVDILTADQCRLNVSGIRSLPARPDPVFPANEASMDLFAWCKDMNGTNVSSNKPAATSISI